MSAEAEVLEVVNRFYAALRSVMQGDAEPMAAVWSHRRDATSMHAFGGRERGWDDVWAAWQRMAEARLGGQVQVEQMHIHVTPELAYVTAVEQVELGLRSMPGVGGETGRFEARVTTVIRLEPRGWVVVHHHADAHPLARAAFGSLG